MPHRRGLLDRLDRADRILLKIDTSEIGPAEVRRRIHASIHDTRLELAEARVLIERVADPKPLLPDPEKEPPR